MTVITYEEISLTEMSVEGVSGLLGSNVIGADQGWQSHTLRVFRLKSGGYTPHHEHNWEHVNYVIKGKGKLHLGDQIHELHTSTFAFVPPNVNHQFENPYSEDFEFICIIPNQST